MEGYTESSCFNHFGIVGPVTDRERFGRLQAFFIADTRQGIQFRGSPENRLLDFPSQLLLLKHQLVSIMVVKPNAFGDTTCEKRKPAGNENAKCPVTTHGLNIATENTWVWDNGTTSGDNNLTDTICNATSGNCRPSNATWADGSTRKWNSGEPNNPGGEDCANITNSNGYWNDLDCDRDQYGIIEFD